MMNSKLVAILLVAIVLICSSFVSAEGMDDYCKVFEGKTLQVYQGEEDFVVLDKAGNLKHKATMSGNGAFFSHIQEGVEVLHAVDVDGRIRKFSEAGVGDSGKLKIPKGEFFRTVYFTGEFIVLVTGVKNCCFISVYSFPSMAFLLFEYNENREPLTDCSCSVSDKLLFLREMNGCVKCVSLAGGFPKMMFEVTPPERTSWFHVEKVTDRYFYVCGFLLDTSTMKLHGAPNELTVEKTPGSIGKDMTTKRLLMLSKGRYVGFENKMNVGILRWYVLEEDRFSEYRAIRLRGSKKTNPSSFCKAVMERNAQVLVDKKGEPVFLESFGQLLDLSSGILYDSSKELTSIYVSAGTSARLVEKDLLIVTDETGCVVNTLSLGCRPEITGIYLAAKTVVYTNSAGVFSQSLDMRKFSVVSKAPPALPEGAFDEIPWLAESMKYHYPVGAYTIGAGNLVCFRSGHVDVSEELEGSITENICSHICLSSESGASLLLTSALGHNWWASEEGAVISVEGQNVLDILKPKLSAVLPEKMVEEALKVLNKNELHSAKLRMMEKSLIIDSGSRIWVVREDETKTFEIEESAFYTGKAIPVAWEDRLLFSERSEYAQCAKGNTVQAGQ